MHVASNHKAAQKLVAPKETLIKVVKLALAVPTDAIKRYRLLWFSTVSIIALILLGVGGGYAFGGTKSTYAPQQFKVILYLTRSLEVHGVIMMALGIGLIFSLGCLTQGFNHRALVASRIAIFCTVLYTVWCSYGFIAAWSINHHYTPTMYWYLGTAALSFFLLILMPPLKSGVNRTESA